MTLKENNELKEFIRKTALLNAVQHDGEAQIGPVMGKILGERAELRTQVKELSALIAQILREVNTLSLAKQKQIVSEKWPERGKTSTTSPKR